MTAADQPGQEQPRGEVPEVAGMPSMDPPVGGPNADPDALDPADLVPGRPGAANDQGDTADA
jgi:hypothetical protein